MNRQVEQHRQEAMTLRDTAAETGQLTDELRDQFSSLPDTEVELEGAITEARANIDVTRTEGGADIVAEFEARKKEVRIC